MRLLQLHLMAYGPFTQQVLHLGTGEQRLVLVHGPNEAGKSSALRAMAGLRFGIDERSPDNFVHPHPQLRIGGVFADAQGHTHAMVRRKGRNNTLRLASLSPTDGNLQELAEPVPPALQALLTAGLSAADYHTMFGIDHAALRRGGQALARGDGEIGAALFEASAGSANVGQLLAQLDDSARELFSPGANARKPKINLALGAYKAQQEEHRRLQVRPSHWQKLDAEAREALAALASAEAALHALQARHLLVKELLGVGPALAELAQAEAALQALDSVRLLAEDAATAHAQASSGLSEAQADAQSASDAARKAQAAADALAPDPALLQAGTAITQLHAAVPVIAALQSELAEAEAEVARGHQALQAAASEIDRGLGVRVGVEALRAQSPSATARAELQAAVAALAAAEDKLNLHQQAANDQADTPEALPPAPDAAALATLRAVLDEVARADEQLQRLARLPAELARGQRAAEQARAALGLTDDDSVRCIRPILSDQLDEAVSANVRIGQQRTSLQGQLQAMQSELAQHQAEATRLLAHGAVPTRDDVAQARARRDQAWALLRQGGGADGHVHAGGQPLPLAYEAAVAQADQLVDTILRDYERVTALELSRARSAELQARQLASQVQARALEAEAEQVQQHWLARLRQASIPAMPPSQLRDWQARWRQLLDQFETQADQRAEMQALQARQQQLQARLRAALQRLSPLLPLAEDEALETLVAVAEQQLRQQLAHSEAHQRAAGQAAQRGRQKDEHARRQAVLQAEQASARARVDALLPSLLLAAGAEAVVVHSRLGQFEALLRAGQAHDEARLRLVTKERLLASHQAHAAALAASLGESVPQQLTLAAGQWATRLTSAQADAQARATALAQAQSARQQADEHQAKAQRHLATLERLVREAGVAGIDAMPEALQQGQRKRQAANDLDKAQARLQQTTRRPRAELQALLAHHDSQALRAEEAALAGQLQAASAALATARTAEETARHALAAIDASGEAAAAADAAAQAAATVRQALPLWMRNRLAHALLQEAVRRFKERTQAPMLVAASGYFAQITGGEFAGLHSDDSAARPVILARRPSGALVPVEGLSEGTQDQLYLALRLAALELQRASGADLPLVLDDVLMTSDDTRAACMLRALSAFAVGGQVIVFTHHAHLCDIARSAVPAEHLAIVGLTRA